jgi:hypothetical protein
MEVWLLALIMLALVLLAFWLWPSWDALSGQIRLLLARTPAGQIEPPQDGPVPASIAVPPHLQLASAPQHHGKRHTVLPHQARGR